MGQFPWNSQQPSMFSRRRLKSTKAHHQTASGLCFEGAPCRTGPRGHRGVTMVWKWRICKVCSTFSGKMMINHGIARGTGATCPDKPTLAMHRGGRPIFDVLRVWQLVCRASRASVRRQISAHVSTSFEIDLEGSNMETLFCWSLLFETRPICCKK